MYENDPHELCNHTKDFNEMMKVFFLVKSRASHLENQSLDTHFEKLEAVLQKFPAALYAYLKLKDSDDMFPEKGTKTAKAWQFLTGEGPETAREAAESIKETLRKIMLFKE
jgi:hypothetical protein